MSREGRIAFAAHVCRVASPDDATVGDLPQAPPAGSGEHRQTCPHWQSQALPPTRAVGFGTTRAPVSTTAEVARVSDAKASQQA
jgi:hypothetical protein